MKLSSRLLNLLGVDVDTVEWDHKDEHAIMDTDNIRIVIRRQSWCGAYQYYCHDEDNARLTNLIEKKWVEDVNSKDWSI